MLGSMDQKPAHFQGKDAISHVAEKQAQGMISSAEIHGTEVPGHIGAFADSARDTAIALTLIALLFGMSEQHPFLLFLLGWTAWKAGRAAWLGWSRLERLHRVLEQERWEIQHNKPQEREELKELYRAKGFEGQLLEDVMDVLMADGDRLLRVMVEEELGLSLKSMEHPLKQGFGAGIGCIASGIFLLLAAMTGSLNILILTAIAIMGLSSALLAHYARNAIIPAITWNVALALFAFGLTYFTHMLFS